MGLCEHCKKAQATFHQTDIKPDGSKVERHYCERCAMEQGLLQIAKPSVNVNDILENFVSSASDKESAAPEVVCEECGINYVEFRNQGLLGCAHDYDAFRKPLAKLIERAQDGGTHHVGKTPQSRATANSSRIQDLRKLRRQLTEAIDAEDYERAASIRDRIQQLETA